MSLDRTSVGKLGQMCHVALGSSRNNWYNMIGMCRNNRPYVIRGYWSEIVHDVFAVTRSPNMSCVLFIACA